MGSGGRLNSGRRMTAAEREAVFEASVITDLSQVPEEYLAMVRREFEARLAERDVPHAS